jgi:hypothetical protein
VPVSQPTTSQPSSLGRQAKRGAKAAGSVVYAGLHPEHVNTLTIGGAPSTHMPASSQSRNGLDCLPGATNSRSTRHLFVSVVVCSAGSTN